MGKKERLEAAAAVAVAEPLPQAIDKDTILLGLNPSAFASLKGGDFKAAADAFQAMADRTPLDVRPKANLASTLVKQGHFDKAVELCCEIIGREPGFHEIYNTIGQAFMCKGDYKRACDAFEAVMLLKPAFHAPKLNRGIIYLLTEKYTEGWAGYDYRFAAKGASLRYDKEHLWLGENSVAPLRIWGEQGLGDEILQASMAADLRARYDGPITWECEPRLVGLFNRSIDGITFVERNDFVIAPLPSEGEWFHLPAISLGRFLRPEADAFPDRYDYLKVDPQAAIARFPRVTDKKRIGISWHSMNATYGPSKSSRLAEWYPLLGLPDCEFVNLQYGITDYDRREFPEIIDTGIDTLKDIGGVADLISTCDLVVTVSNTVAHLAGALGVETCVLTNSQGAVPWFWGLGDKTPWYPSVELFRKLPGLTWTDLLGKIVERIKGAA